MTENAATPCKVTASSQGANGDDGCHLGADAYCRLAPRIEVWNTDNATCSQTSYCVPFLGELVHVSVLNVPGWLTHCNVATDVASGRQRFSMQSFRHQLLHMPARWPPELIGRRSGSNWVVVIGISRKRSIWGDLVTRMGEFRPRDFTARLITVPGGCGLHLTAAGSGVWSTLRDGRALDWAPDHSSRVCKSRPTGKSATGALCPRPLSLDSTSCARSTGAGTSVTRVSGCLALVNAKERSARSIRSIRGRMIKVQVREFVIEAHLAQADPAEARVCRLAAVWDVTDAVPTDENGRRGVRLLVTSNGAAS